MKKIILNMIALSAIFSQPLWAHENHGEIPGALKAQHGGIPKAGREINMEMLAQGKTIFLYTSAHPGDSVNLNAITLTGTAKSPKGKPYNLNFSKKEDVFTTEVDMQGSHRINLEIKANVAGKIDIFKFIVEK